VTSRFRLVLVVGTLALAGCSAQWTGPIPYRDHERFAKDLDGKPKLQDAIRKGLARHFGDDLRLIKVPESSGLRDDGRYLANFIQVGEKREPVVEKDRATGKTVAIEGGYALYRKNCLHCHGVFGAGDGPTATFLYPKPRDYRLGVYKFTSTNPVNAKPTRADLRKTILYGLHGTSMPGFEALMSPSAIEQVIDYMTFLSIRGETERYLIDEAMNSEDVDADAAVGDDVVKETIARVAATWKEAETQVVNPTVGRSKSSPESVKRGRDLYLGTNPALPKLECAGCHGTSGRGNGGSFVEYDIFRDVVLRFYPLDQAVDRFYRVETEKDASHEAGKVVAPDPAGLGKFLEENPLVVSHLRKNRGLMTEVSNADFSEKLKTDLPGVVAESRKLLPDLDDPRFRELLIAKMDLWSKSLDDWGNPLRPANLIEGVYKGGRRPLDLYWRIAKGINGVKMPAHAGLLTDEQIWDVVNFVLALPEDPDLLPASAPTPAKPPHAVAATH
jgi:mono/diheme cytochrome c family protein